MEHKGTLHLVDSRLYFDFVFFHVAYFCKRFLRFIGIWYRMCVYVIECYPQATGRQNNRENGHGVNFHKIICKFLQRTFWRGPYIGWNDYLIWVVWWCDGEENSLAFYGYHFTAWPPHLLGMIVKQHLWHWLGGGEMNAYIVLN